MDKDNKNIQKKKGFFKIPQTKQTVKGNVILAAGLLLILAGAVLCVKLIYNGSDISVFKSLIFVIIGEGLLFISLAFNRDAIPFFLGGWLIIDGILFFLIENKFIPFSFKEAWPCFLLSAGVSLICTDLYISRRLRSVFLFPALALITFGCGVMLFSMHIIKVSFSKFISIFGPLILAVSGIVLIILFIMSRKQSQIFPYMEDDTVGTGDEGFGE